MGREIYEVFGQHFKIEVGKLNHKSDVAYSRLVSARSITKPKTSKGKAKTACQFCGKLFVFIDKHEKKCKKNPENQ